jgi:hypothetical protein
VDASAILDLAIPFIIAILATALLWGQEWWFKRDRTRDESTKEHSKAAL